MCAYDGIDTYERRNHSPTTAQTTLWKAPRGMGGSRGEHIFQLQKCRLQAGGVSPRLLGMRHILAKVEHTCRINCGPRLAGESATTLGEECPLPTLSTFVPALSPNLTYEVEITNAGWAKLKMQGREVQQWGHWLSYPNNTYITPHSVLRTPITRIDLRSAVKWRSGARQRPHDPYSGNPYMSWPPTNYH